MRDIAEFAGAPWNSARIDGIEATETVPTMLAAEEQGLATCAQEAWMTRHKTVAATLGLPDEQRIWCGLALGHADPDAPVNTLRSERAPVADFAVFDGF